MDISVSDLVKVLSSKLESWVVGVVKMLPNLLMAVLIFVFFWFLGKILRSWLTRALRHFEGQQTLVGLASAVLFTAVVALGLFIALGVLNLDKTVTSLLAGAGVLGLALGFAFQEIATNFLSGIFLAFEKPIREGDIVEIKGHMGTVMKINLRTTIIRKFDGVEVQVPNKNVFTDVIINFTTTPERRVEILVGVSYGDDLEKVTDIVTKVLEELPHRIKDKAPDVFCVGYGDSSINFSCRFWVDYPANNNYLRAQHAAIIAIKKAFDANDIMIPFPIRTLDFGIKGGVTMKEEMKAFLPDPSEGAAEAKQD